MGWRGMFAMGLGVVLSAGSAWSAEPEEKPEKHAAAKVINFEDDTIQGDLTRPDGEYLESRGKTVHSSLIRVRENFQEKVLESVGKL